MPKRALSFLILLGLLTLVPPGDASLALAENPPHPALAAPVGPARVVRAAASAHALDEARARLAARGRPTDFILWTDASGSLTGAAPDATVEAIESEGIVCDVLFDTIAAYGQARERGEPLARAIEPPAEPAEVPVVAIVDLGGSRPGAFAADPELVLRRNDQYAAVLETAPVAADATARTALVERYRAQGLTLGEIVPFGEFPAASGRFFPEDPFAFEPEAARGSDAYSSYEGIEAGLRSLAAQRPDLARFTTIGRSYEGREIWAVKLSTSPEIDDPGKPDVLITGCYHAREWIAAEVPYRLALQLPGLYASDDRVRYLLDTTEVWIVPVVNVDGFVYSQQRSNHDLDTIRLWRKNRRPIDVNGDGRPEGTGVDLNRNHGFAWRLEGDLPYPATDDDFGASDSPGNFQTYRGPAPDSELEVRAVNALSADPAHDFVARLDYHNYSQLILYPVGYANEASIDDLMLADVGIGIRNAIAALRGTDYTAVRAINLYPTTGNSTDYAYGVDKLLAYTVELSPRQGGFDLPESNIEPVVAENIPGALALVEWAAGPARVASVRATQGDQVVYQARWERSGSGRSLIVERRTALEPGPLRVDVAFSRPVNLKPRMSLTLAGATVSLGVSAGPVTRYAGDTWSGQAQIQSVSAAGARLSVALDGFVSRFDPDPLTVARYSIGTGAWAGLEAFGSDSSYTLGLTVEDQPPVAEFAAPGPSAIAADGFPERVFAVGEPITIAWEASDDNGVTEQLLEYSTDGGSTFVPIGTGAIDASRREVSWTPSASAVGASVVLQLTVGDSGGNRTRVRLGQGIAISRVHVAGVPSYRRGKLRVDVLAGALAGAKVVEAFVDGGRVNPARVGVKAIKDRVQLRGTLQQLGFDGGPTLVRLVVDGVPTTAVTVELR